MADLETLDRRKQKTEKKVRAGDKKAAFEVEFLAKLIGLLDKGEWLGNREYTAEERVILNECQLLSAKPVLFVANVSEGKNADEAMVQTVREFAAKRGARVVTICGQLEAELSSLPESERADFLNEMGLTESGLVRLTREAYTLAGPGHLLHCRRDRISRLADSERHQSAASSGQDPLRHGTRFHPCRGLPLRRSAGLWVRSEGEGEGIVPPGRQGLRHQRSGYRVF